MPAPLPVPQSTAWPPEHCVSPGPGVFPGVSRAVPSAVGAGQGAPMRGRGMRDAAAALPSPWQRLRRLLQPRRRLARRLPPLRRLPHHRCDHPDGAPAGFGGGRSQPFECFSVGTAVGGCPMVCMWQASGAGVTRFAAGVLWSSRCFDVGVGFWHVPVFGYGLATGRCVAQEPGGEVGSVTGCTRPKILGGRVPVRGLPGGGTMPLLRGALRVGTHCHWCAMAVVRSWSFAWHKVSSVNSGVSSLGSAALMAFMPRCLLHWCRCETLLLHL